MELKGINEALDLTESDWSNDRGHPMYNSVVLKWGQKGCFIDPTDDVLATFVNPILDAYCSFVGMLPENTYAQWAGYNSELNITHFELHINFKRNGIRIDYPLPPFGNHSSINFTLK